MNYVEKVTSLFDSKASSWDSNYSPEGRLAQRVDIFASLLAEQVEPGASLLDFGCGTGAIARHLVERGFKVTACDVSEQMIANGKRIHGEQTISWYLLPSEWKRFPFADETFDAIIASSVFEYLDDADNVLEECRRILGVGGKLIISVPDPQHILRRLENAARPLAELGSKIPLVRRLPRIGNYLAYLRVSRSRYPMDVWKQKAHDAAFGRVDVDLPKPELDGAGAMMYLAFER